MKKYLIPLFFVFLGCGEHSLNDMLDYLKYSSSSESGLSLGLVPNTIIPDDMRSDVEDKMPIYRGTTPPDISGKYLSSYNIITGSSRNEDRDDVLAGKRYADLYFAFTKKADKIYYREIQITDDGEASGNSDDLAVDVVGEGDNFTAYFIEVGESRGIRIKQSTVISGTMTSSGIKDFYYSFIMLEKGSDPNNKLVPVKTYRIFKDSDGLAEKNNWSF